MEDGTACATMRNQVRQLRGEKNMLQASSLQSKKQIEVLKQHYQARQVAAMHASEQITQCQQALGIRTAVLEEVERERDYLRVKADASVQDVLTVASEHAGAEVAWNRNTDEIRRLEDGLTSQFAQLADTLKDEMTSQLARLENALKNCELQDRYDQLTNTHEISLQQLFQAKQLLDKYQKQQITHKESAKAWQDRITALASDLDTVKSDCMQLKADMNAQQVTTPKDIGAKQSSSRRKAYHTDSAIGTKRKAVSEDSEESESLAQYNDEAYPSNAKRPRNVYTTRDMDLYEETASPISSLRHADSRVVTGKAPPSFNDRSREASTWSPGIEDDLQIPSESSDEEDDETLASRASSHQRKSTSLPQPLKPASRTPTNVGKPDMQNRRSQHRVLEDSIDVITISDGSGDDGTSTARASSYKLAPKKRAGRPPGSKNKVTVPAESEQPTPATTTASIQMRLSDLRDPEYEHPLLSKNVNSYLHKAVQDWDRRKPGWTKRPYHTKTRCLHAYTFNNGQPFGSELRNSACPGCIKARRYCVTSIEGKEGLVPLMPAKTEVDIGVGPENDAYWVLPKSTASRFSFLG